MFTINETNDKRAWLICWFGHDFNKVDAVFVLIGYVLIVIKFEAAYGTKNYTLMGRFASLLGGFKVAGIGVVLVVYSGGGKVAEPQAHSFDGNVLMILVGV